jgi:predicted metal-dependent peptidase
MRRWYPTARRHIHRGLYLPRQQSDYLSLTVALDTSGSCASALSNFVAQLNFILNAFRDYEVTVLQCDTDLRDVLVVTPDQPLSVEQIITKGYGGTDFSAVFDYVYEHPTPGLVFFTDGQVWLPDQPPDVPVLWVLTAYGAEDIPWGQVARMG